MSSRAIRHANTTYGQKFDIDMEAVCPYNACAKNGRIACTETHTLSTSSSSQPLIKRGGLSMFGTLSVLKYMIDGQMDAMRLDIEEPYLDLSNSIACSTNVLASSMS